MTNDTPFYVPRNGAYAPTGLGVSPWNGHSQSGVALAGLIAHVLGCQPANGPTTVARVTIDIQGAVPMQPLIPRVRLLRDGARFQTFELTLGCGERIWARATALRARIEPSPPAARPSTRAFPDPEEIAAAAAQPGWIQAIARQGAFLAAGPGAQWIRIRNPVVEGSPLTALERAAMVADFGSGTGSLFDFDSWRMANLDISLHLTRPPRGEWLLVEAASESAGNGIGIAHARLGDADGLFGAAHQTVFLDPRGR